MTRPAAELKAVGQHAQDNKPPKELVMLKGKLIDLRIMHESDLDTYYELYHGGVARCGEFWPSEPNTFKSMPEVMKRFQEDG